MAEYASKGVANTALGLGIAGTALSAITGAGGIAGVLGIGPKNTDSGDRPVTRYELDLIQQINAKNNEIVAFKAAQYTDQKAEGLQAQISQQAVFNATSVATMNFIQQQITALQGITQLVVPNRNVEPGWGPVEVRPFPPFPAPAPTTNNGGTVTTTTGTGN